MKLKFDGNVGLDKPPETVMAFLSDGSSIASCIPDSENFRKIDDKTFLINVKVGVGVVNGKFDAKYTVVEKNSNHITYKIEWSGVGSKVSILLTADVAGNGSGSEMKWGADCEMSGIVTGVGENVLRGISNGYIKQIIDNVKKKVG